MEDNPVTSGMESSTGFDKSPVASLAGAQDNAARNRPLEKTEMSFWDARIRNLDKEIHVKLEVCETRREFVCLCKDIPLIQPPQKEDYGRTFPKESRNDRRYLLGLACKSPSVILRYVSHGVGFDAVFENTASSGAAAMNAAKTSSPPSSVKKAPSVPHAVHAEHRLQPSSA